MKPNTPRQLAEPLKKNKRVPVIPANDSPVTVGNKSKTNREFSKLGKIDLEKSKIIINLTPRLHKNDQITLDQEGDDIAYTHYKLNDQGVWVKQRIIHRPIKVDRPQFDPEEHEGFVSYEDPNDGSIRRYFIQTNQQTVTEDLTLEGIEIDVDKIVSFVSGYNPFYERNRLVESLYQFDLSSLDNQSLSDSVESLRRAIAEETDPLGEMLALSEQVKYLSQGLLYITVGLKSDGVLLRVLK